MKINCNVQRRTLLYQNLDFFLAKQWSWISRTHKNRRKQICLHLLNTSRAEIMPSGSFISFTLSTSIYTIYRSQKWLWTFPPTYSLCLKLKKEFFFGWITDNLEMGYFHPTCELSLNSLEAVPKSTFLKKKLKVYHMHCKHTTDILPCDICDNNTSHFHASEEFHLHLNYTLYPFTQNL